jgi:hypothetical protein
MTGGRFHIDVKPLSSATLSSNNGIDGAPAGFAGAFC